MGCRGVDQRSCHSRVISTSITIHSSANQDWPHEISQRSSRDKNLEFLSACQALTGDQKMPDEVVHLADGMRIGGYPSVIVTMWSISDSDAPLVADQVYGQLIRDVNLDRSKAGHCILR